MSKDSNLKEKKFQKKEENLSTKKKEEIENVIKNNTSEKIKEQFVTLFSNNNLKVFSKDSFVVCIDIRNSTKLMTISIDSKIFIDFIAELVQKFKHSIVECNGIFDKFTGDGVLCHFPIFNDSDKKNIRENVIWLFEKFNNIFTIEYNKHLKQKLFPIEFRDVGIGIGCDYGTVDYKIVNSTFYAVGLPVVYACRLSCAPARCVYLNIRAYLETQSKNFIKKSIDIKNEGAVNVYSREYFVC